ncbi:hypothetical protein P8452_64287 [Trifolium repens]|nr:hypothetical protein P8452_64287 [Trifolium repens]
MFVYNVILFLFLFLVLTFGEKEYHTDSEIQPSSNPRKKECVRDADCNALYPDTPKGTMVCFLGICKNLFPPYN